MKKHSKKKNPNVIVVIAAAIVVLGMIVMVLLVGGMVWGEGAAPPAALPSTPPPASVTTPTPTTPPPTATSTTTSNGNLPEMWNMGSYYMPKSELGQYWDSSANTGKGDWRDGVSYDPATKTWTAFDGAKTVYTPNGGAYVQNYQGATTVRVWEDGSYTEYDSLLTFDQLSKVDYTNNIPVFTLNDGTVQVGNTDPIPSQVYKDNIVNIDYSAAASASLNAPVPLKNGGSISTIPNLPEGTTGYKITSSATDPNPQTVYVSELGAGQTATLTVPAGGTTGELVITHFDDGSIFGGTTTNVDGTWKLEGNKFVSDGATYDPVKKELTQKGDETTQVTTYSESAIATEELNGDERVSYKEIYSNGDYLEWEKSLDEEDSDNGYGYYNHYNQNGELISTGVDGVDPDNNIDIVLVIRADGGADQFASSDIDPKTGLPKDKSFFDEKTGKYKEKENPDKTSDELERDYPKLSSEIAWNTFLTGRSSFAYAGDILSAYKSEQAISNLIFGEEALSQWRESVDQFFASTYLGTEYWVSDICAAEFDVIGGSVAAIETAGGVFQFIGTVQGERSEPVPLLCDADGSCAKGVCRTQDKVCVGSGNQTITEYFYKITYGVTAPEDSELTPMHNEEGAISFNIAITGSEKSATLFTDFVDLGNGDSQKNAVVKYSPYLYDKVCLIFGKKPEGRSGAVSEICNDIAVSQKSFNNFNNNAGSEEAASGESGGSQGAVYCEECW